jgi:hypothetical protein
MFVVNFIEQFYIVVFPLFGVIFNAFYQVDLREGERGGSPPSHTFPLRTGWSNERPKNVVEHYNKPTQGVRVLWSGVVFECCVRVLCSGVVFAWTGLLKIN